MIRIFSLLSIVAILMPLIAGSGIYWNSQSSINAAKEQTTTSLAQGLALNISAQVNSLHDIIAKMAKTTEVVEAIESEDPRQMLSTSLILEQYLPNVMAIRILPATMIKIDNSRVPLMGNADLIMAQDTLLKPQPAAVQGQGENRHLAITTVITIDGRPAGIILASVKYNFLQSDLNSSYLSNSLLEIKQQNASLAKTKNLSADTALDKKIAIPNTSWSIHYAADNPLGLSSFSTTATIIVLPALMVTLALFICYRHLSNMLRQDLDTILKAIKDLFSGKTVGSYPLKFNEMNSLISTMVQFKRVLDHGGTEFPSELVGNTKSDNFFDEPEGVSFLNMEDDLLSEGTSIAMPSTPVSLPEPESVATDFPALSVVNSVTDIEVEEIPAAATPSATAASIYRAYDIRGIADQTLTKELVHDIGKAIASEVKEKNINTLVIGRDGRLSSEAFAESLTQGITSTGVNVLDVGQVPSPLVYFVAQHTEGKSAVVITASHNPAQYNGLKVIIDGVSLSGDRIQQIKKRVDDNNFTVGNPGSVNKNDMFINEYIGIIAEDTHLVRPMKVVVDCGNGVAGKLAPMVLKTLGCEVFELFCDIDGNFPNHHPDPTNPDNLQNLIAGVEHYQADIGLAFDGDGDRLGVIDSKGKIIWPDRLLMLFAKDVLANKPGAEIIYDVKSSHHLKKYIAKQGGRSLMWKTGHSLIKAKIKETGAALAGEMSGHIFFNDRWFGFDDAIYAAARLIGILSDDTRDSAAVFADLPESTSTPEINIELAEGENTLLMERIIANANFKGADLITLDGLRANFPDGWGLVRASNTMPALSLRFEADDNTALERIQSEFKNLLIQIRPDLNIPF